MNKRAMGAVLLALALPLSACGSGDDEKAARSISKELRGDQGSEMALDKKQSDCVAEGFVDEIGTEKLQEYGMLDKNFEAKSTDELKMAEADAEKAATTFEDCAPVKKMMLSAFEQQEMPAEAQDCIEGKMTDEVLHDFLVDLFSGDQQGAGEGFGKAVQECATAG
jgi:hypothetical protein